jgi:hypothetical protein
MFSGQRFAILVMFFLKLLEDIKRFCTFQN